MTLDLFRLLVFVTVVDRNGYSAAARQLHLAQSTVSHHVSELERACNAELLQYKERSVHVTAAGHEVYQTALVMLAEQDRLGRSLGDLRQGRVGRVRLGASMALEQRHFLNDVIAPFCHANGGTTLSLRFGHSRREAQAVLDRELDLAYVIRWHLPDDAHFEYLHGAELAFLVARDHPLAAAATVTVEDIAAAGLITAPMYGAESYYYREVLRERGISGEQSTLEVDGLQARGLAAAAGLGVMAAFVPRHLSAPPFEALVALPVAGDAVTVELGLVRRETDDRSPATEALAAWLRRMAGGTPC
ncbi:LysR family transcriptional regulator [Pseudonocardia sp. GCM10023141]|uniref:LysR family transcriptional regulator n=1 Tax=Pseudonocardia sp. GCM10023141 TaxID=3252653 RepID=UPI00360E0064